MAYAEQGGRETRKERERGGLTYMAERWESGQNCTEREDG